MSGKRLENRSNRRAMMVVASHSLFFVTMFAALSSNVAVAQSARIEPGFYHCENFVRGQWRADNFRGGTYGVRGGTYSDYQGRTGTYVYTRSTGSLVFHGAFLNGVHASYTPGTDELHRARFAFVLHYGPGYDLRVRCMVQARPDD